MEMDNLRQLYVDELKDLWSAERQLVKALPKMAKSATNPELQSAFEEHLAVTEAQATPGVEDLTRVQAALAQGQEQPVQLIDRQHRRGQQDGHRVIEA